MEASEGGDVKPAEEAVTEKEETKEREKGVEAEESKGADTSRELLIRQLREQVEGFLAPENLSRDPSLSAKATDDGFIAIDVLHAIPLIASLTPDRDLLLDAIRSSRKLRMNAQETMVKSQPPVERTTLILRDMPPEVPKQEIYAIFAHSECGNVKELRAEIGNTWFVKFHSEEDCLKTVKFLQRHGKFRNNPLHVRVKSNIHSPQKFRSAAARAGAAAGYSQYQPATNGGYAGYRTAEAGQMDYSHTRRQEPMTTGGRRRMRPPQQVPATSDYPGSFLFYEKNEFLAIWEKLRDARDLGMPRSMRDIDSDVITERESIPASVVLLEEELNELQGAVRRPRDEERRGNRARGRGRGRQRNRGRRRPPPMYEEHMYREYDEPMGGFAPPSPQQKPRNRTRRRNRGQANRSPERGPAHALDDRRMQGFYRPKN